MPLLKLLKDLANINIKYLKLHYIILLIILFTPTVIYDPLYPSSRLFIFSWGRYIVSSGLATFNFEILINIPNFIILQRSYNIAIQDNLTERSFLITDYYRHIVFFHIVQLFIYLIMGFTIFNKLSINKLNYIPITTILLSISIIIHFILNTEK